jgi:hypothetical protein
VTIDIATGGEVMAQMVSGPTGQFDYVGPAPEDNARWQFRLPDYQNGPLLQLEVAEGLRYLLEFKAQSIPVQDEALPDEQP